MGAALVQPGSDYLYTKGLPLITCILQGDEYDELGSVTSQLHEQVMMKVKALYTGQVVHSATMMQMANHLLMHLRGFGQDPAQDQ